MKRDPALIPLSREHHKVLLCAQLLKTDVANYKGLPSDPEGKRLYVQELYDSLLTAHIKAEERHVFPLARKIGGELAAVADELEKEHRELRRMVKALEDSSVDLPIALDTLGRLLEAHVRKEERVFFQKLQAEASPGQLKEMEKALAEG